MAESIVDTLEIPQGTSVELNGADIKVRASGKENYRNFRSTEIYLKQNGQSIEVWARSGRRNVLAEGHAIASHVRNLITGVQKQYEARLEVIFSHFPMNVSVKGNHVEILNLAGAKHPKKARIIGESKVEIKGKEITVKGTNKEHVGQTAANMEQVTRVKGKDNRVFQDRIYVTKKAGQN
ncbi:MAG: 50S ribosomal protein L6 [Candidatus Diapherotrites archaeon]|uniref:50S ribosomal protein L6 n=1 Tax=Candidatus Iainarchaeum sp. TaxID=3101447 RepID=A0A8T3YPP4_9ARCH|nr:50S ribosomal protein L6 [Candidatus Diapherotrites archaeon]